jgi:hypothetical protein
MILISGSTPEVDSPIDLCRRIEKRMACIAQDDPFDPDIYGQIVVVETGAVLTTLPPPLASTS